MNLSRCLGVLAGWCLFLSSALADHTFQDFSHGGANGTPYTRYGNRVIGQIMSDGPIGALDYFRLAYNGVFGTNSMLAFDRTQTGAVSHVVVDFDYRIGGAVGPPTAHADGIGFVLLNTAA